MAISILDMGNTKKRNVRESIISILSREYPLSIRKIYTLVKKDYKLEVTYQAVFKLVKEMLADNILQNGEDKMEYQLNMGWIKSLEDELGIIKKSYGDKSSLKLESKKEANARFVAEIGPKIKEYFGNDIGLVLSTSSNASKLLATLMTQHLLREGIKVEYCELNKYTQLEKKELLIPREKIQGRKVLILDSLIQSGKTYEIIMNKLQKYKRKYNILDIKWAVQEDYLGIADFTSEKDK